MFQKFLFYLIVFLIPSNLAKHWSQKWSLVNGILVDYLIPTLYLTDILITGLLGLWLVELIKDKKLKNGIANFSSRSNKNLVIFFFILLITHYYLLITGKIINSPAAIYKLIKLTEFFFLIIYIKNNINIKKDIKKITQVLSYSIIWQSVLAISQWFNQGSIFGYWFFGEQLYNTATLGIKKINFFGQLKIPAYGTFPHPNVLAGFLSLSLILILSYLTHDRRSIRINSREKGVEIIAFFLGVIALFLTFSFPSWIILVFSIWYLVIRKMKDGKIKHLLYVLCSMFYVLIFWYGSKIAEISSIIRRQNLAKIAFWMWLSSPIFGVGLNNFIVRMEEFGQVKANIRFLQPVHNIYLLILAEAGIIGLLVVGCWLLVVGKKLKKKNHPLFYVLCSMFFLGLFDHYFLTIQQGMLILALILGLGIM